MYEVDDFVGVFKALANPHRLTIFLSVVEELEQSTQKEIKKNPEEALACQQSAAKRLGIAPSTMSHHVKTLSQVGLIQIRREGQDVVWSLDDKGQQILKQFCHLIKQ